MKAPSLLRALGLVALVFGATWLAAVLYWRTAATDVTAGHLVLCLLVLPLLLLAVLIVVRARLRRRRAASRTGDAVAQETVAADGPAPESPLLLYAAAAWSRAGSELVEIAASLAAPARPPLDPELRDSMGLPVFAAAVEGLDPAYVAEVLAAGPVGRHLRDAMPLHALRALALLEPVVEDLLLAALALDPHDALPSTRDGEAHLHPHAIHHSRSAQAGPAAGPAPPLRILALLPATWPAPLRDAAGHRIEALAATAGLTGERVVVEVIPATGADQSWQALDRLAAEPAPGVRHLLVAADSMLDPGVVAALESNQELLVSGHLEGRIPGEAAAGVLLGRPGATAVAEAPVRVHACCHAVAGRGRAAAADSARLLQAALEAADLLPEPDTLVFTDADHRPSRAVEAAGAITGALPDADAVGIGRHLGTSCGDIGIAAPLVLLAAATGHVRQNGAPALVLGLAGEIRRTALAISPLQAAGGGAEDTPAAAAATA